MMKQVIILVILLVISFSAY
ncbi:MULTISPECIES: type I toxin-antitoxin system Ibs family toxin [Citrobacter]|uniref:Type I toxin-antitoxin system Ibs family toxin n=1 Tax=Citrobacter pasteurii TaxID=1563222 RepID=A0A6N6K4E1_9ENTR|nr:MULTISPECIES: type I toxin-antitoxin system Ibs family toxin [Citrobacter]KAA1278865.1 type I toxin-antitoxin system Ibs family toxin [Citrobacter pasteurii]MBA4711634.1 type I toxin-antitoxin system Ibs family toxin [Citrobacter pasteurii]MBA7944196.1 type I toxin-antitoxin system Ibs family toxin [Citrobacter sp. RHBSTW-00271]MBA7968021.1 type I toxin-antitoxin system Ibs family toxin [Citrobacter sp. RHBSTW-00671]MBD0800157.1 type I toxin-antitoxin system Ibs family toxin [Citrobacter sp